MNLSADLPVIGSDEADLYFWVITVHRLFGLYEVGTYSTAKTITILFFNINE